MRFVHDVEDDSAIRFEFVGKVLPKCLEVGGASDDSALVSHKVVRVNSRKGTLVGDVVDDRLQSIQVRSIKCTSDADGGRAEALQLEGDAEGVESLTDKVVDRAWTRPCIVSSK